MIGEEVPVGVDEIVISFDYSCGRFAVLWADFCSSRLTGSIASSPASPIMISIKFVLIHIASLPCRALLLGRPLWIVNAGNVPILRSNNFEGLSAFS